MDWETIDSAPKDETDILLRGKTASGIPRPPVVAGWFERNVVPGWYSHENIDEHIDMVPTHWCAVPDYYEDEE